MSTWTWQAPPWAVILGVALWLVLAGLAVRHVRRSPRPRPALGREALRLLAAGLIVITLWRPERVHTQPRQHQPQLVVLADASGSMATQDVEREGAEPQTRAAWLAASRAQPLWAPLVERYQVHEATFGEPDPASTAPAGTDLQSALAGLLGAYPHLQAVLLLSDGDWNLGGSPAGAAARLALHQVPVYAVAVGRGSYLPDTVLDQVKPPAFALLREQVTIPFRVQNRLDRPLETELRLEVGGRTVATRPLTVPAQGQVQDTLLWPAELVGEQRFVLRLPAQPEESLVANNQAEFALTVRDERLRVLVVESLPRWEYRFLRNALQRDPGVEVDCLLLHPELGPAGGAGYLRQFPATRDRLAAYDVIFLGDVGVGAGELPPEAPELLRGVVEQLGSGLVFLPGWRGRQLSLLETPLGELLPVTFDPALPAGTAQPQEAHLQLTDSGADHLLTMLERTPARNRQLWRVLPGFTWFAPVQRARPGSEVLAVHATWRNEWGRLPLLVIRQAGQGQTLFMGTDSAWRWRKGVEDTYHYRFWGQVVRWMAHPRHLASRSGIRLTLTPEAPHQGDDVLLHAALTDPAGFPLTGATVQAEVATPGGGQELLPLSPVAGGWGVYQGRFQARAAGDYRLTVRSGGQEVALGLSVPAATLEQVGAPANTAALREITRLSGGELATTAEAADMIARIALAPEAAPRQLRQPLWSQWYWGLLLLALLVAYWAWRKLAGLV